MGTQAGEGRGRRAGRRTRTGSRDYVPEAPELAGQDIARSPSKHATDLEGMRFEVEGRMMRGDRFTDVEDAIDATALSADEKSALWLLAWSYVDWRAQRREARAHLATFAGHEAGAPVGRPGTLRLVL